MSLERDFLEKEYALFLKKTRRPHCKYSLFEFLERRGALRSIRELPTAIPGLSTKYFLTCVFDGHISITCPHLEKAKNSYKDVREVTSEEAFSIIETRRPLGQFLTLDNSIYVGIDNRTGDAWTEEFKTKAECIEWLMGDE